MQFPPELTKRTVPKFFRNGRLVSTLPSGTQVYDLHEVTRIDGAGLAFLCYLKQKHEAQGGSCEFVGLPDALAAQLKAYQSDNTKVEATTAEPALNPIAAFGKFFCSLLIALRHTCAFVGELIWYSIRFLLAPRAFRWGDCRTAFYRCGVQAVPVVMLMGFLLGLILAFQSAIPLKMFGGEGFVGGLVGIAMVRELGLIITAILVAGRSGSSFAAELGTMQVNEEIDALETMGLHPVRFLVLPRVVAGTMSMPVLGLFATLAGLIGGWLVMQILGYSTVYYLHQLQAFVHLKDLIGSFCKSFIFGWVVAGVGCYFGLHAGRDAGAVGTSTTSAVVTGIMLIAVLEGLFSVVFYAMGW